jgi:hypothetical protein
MSAAVSQMRWRIWALDSPWPESRPARPDTCGVAIEVPLIVLYPLFSHDE